jgi:hypothetical protein
VSTSLSVFPIKAANMLIIDKSRNLCQNQLTCNTKNQCSSDDAHFQNGVVIVSLAPWPIKNSDMLVMENSEQIVTQLTYSEY